MGSDNHHPFDLPDPPAGNGREQAIRKAVAAFDEKYSPAAKLFIPRPVSGAARRMAPGGSRGELG
jgi:hypothetical protein